VSETELLRELRRRVDAAVKPIRDVYGDDAPTVRMALRILAEAEDAAALLAERRLTTQDASEATGWNAETLQHYARLRLAGETMPDGWEGLIVERVGRGYLFVAGSIPAKPRAAA
jgi:hypothetical protein